MDNEALRVQLIEKVCRLPADQLAPLSRFLDQTSELAIPQPTIPANMTRDWPHAPIHRIHENGTYMLTAGTYQKAHHFCDARKLSHLEDSLLTIAKQYDWQLEAWAVFSNHYHFVGHTLSSPSRLGEFIKDLHAKTAVWLNEQDRTPNRCVWHNFWDKQLTFEKSYLARLHYVHQNAAKHRLVPVGNQYRWCSAAWFERTARPATVKTFYGFKIDGLKVLDDFEPVLVS